MARTPRPTFNTLPFRTSHMREPRGRGSWAFCPYAKRNAADYLDHTIFSPSMTYAEAKRWAMQQPALKDCSLISVLP